MELPLSTPARNADGTYTLRTNISVRQLTALSLKEETQIPITAYSKVMIYPNPSEGAITIEIPNYIKRPYTVKIHDLTGRLVSHLTGTASKQLVDLTNLHKGLYLFTLYNGYQGVVHYEKLVVQ